LLAQSVATGEVRNDRPSLGATAPVFSPRDLRHRRISLLHGQGRTWAEIGRLVGQRKLSITADTYTHVLSDGRELDYATLVSALARP
jgi:integrase